MTFLHILSSGIFRQYIAAFTCTLSAAILGSAIGWTSPAIPNLKNNVTGLTITDHEITWMVSSLYVANFLSPIPCGHLMDYFGRRNSMLCLSLFPIASWIIVLFAKRPCHLYIGRFLCGILFGATYTIAPIYIGEISEPKLRGSLGNLISMMAYAGALFEYIIGPYTSYNALIYASMCLPVIYILTYMWMPESPYYLIIKKRHQEAIQSLIWLRGNNKTEDDVIKEIKLIEDSINEQMKTKKTFKDLLSTKGNRRGLIIIIVLCIAQRLTGVGALMAYSSITVPDNSIPGLAVNNLITILGTVWFGASLFSTFLVDKLGRKPLLVISLFGSGLCTLLASTWFYLHEKTPVDVSNLKFIPYISFLLHALFYSIGIGPTGASMKGELFPANIKSKASAVTTMVLALSSFFVNKSYLTIADTFGMYCNYLIYAISCFLTVVFTMFYVIETKGKTLQAIQDELNGKTGKSPENVPTETITLRY